MFEFNLGIRMINAEGSSHEKNMESSNEARNEKDAFRLVYDALNFGNVRKKLKLTNS